MNKIVWKFSYCTTYVENTHNCAVPLEVKESGVTFVHIRQEKVLKEGLREIHPTPDQCKNLNSNSKS